MLHDVQTNEAEDAMSAVFGSPGQHGNKGVVPFVFPDGWAIFLTSRNGAREYNSTLTPVFDVSLPRYYGDDSRNMLGERPARLIALVEELQCCRKFRQSVVLHCNHGRSRSVACLGIYLMVTGPLDATGRYNWRHAIGALTAAFLVADNEGIAHWHEIGKGVQIDLMAFSSTMAPA